MFHPEAVVGVVGIVAVAGLVASRVVSAVVNNVLRLRAASAPSAPSVAAGQEERMAQMEAEIAALREEVGRLSAVENFYAQLQAPASASRPDRPATGT